MNLARNFGNVSQRSVSRSAIDMSVISRLSVTVTPQPHGRREVVDPAFAEHRGRFVKPTGDGMLVEFTYRRTFGRIGSRVT